MNNFNTEKIGDDIYEEYPLDGSLEPYDIWRNLQRYLLWHVNGFKLRVETRIVFKKSVMVHQ